MTCYLRQRCNRVEVRVRASDATRTGNGACSRGASCMGAVARSSLSLGCARRRGLASAWAVDMGPMPDADDDHGVLVVDAENDPVVASTSAAMAVQLASQRLAEPLRVVSQRTGDELDDRRGDFTQQTP